jgi:pilus assembly protein CpaB
MNNPGGVMSRPGTLTIVGFFAFLMASCASLLSYNYLKKQPGGVQNQGVSIVAAATDIAIGTTLDSSHLKLSTWPKTDLPAGYYTNAAPPIGRVVVRQLSTGDIITEHKLLPLSRMAGSGIMAYIVPQGHRAVTVAVNEVAGVAGFITPGSRVDIVLTTPQPGASDKDDNISKIILQNIPVLASGQVTEQKNGKPVIVPTVTMDLVPDDAEKLIVGTRKGVLQLLLRNVIDITAVDTKGATIPSVLNTGTVTGNKHGSTRPRSKQAASIQPRLEQAPFIMEVIQGGVRSFASFPAKNDVTAR